jgi:hypothetical protein
MVYVKAILRGLRLFRRFVANSLPLFADIMVATGTRLSEQPWGSALRGMFGCCGTFLHWQAVARESRGAPCGSRAGAGSITTPLYTIAGTWACGWPGIRIVCAPAEEHPHHCVRARGWPPVQLCVPPGTEPSSLLYQSRRVAPCFAMLCDILGICFALFTLCCCLFLARGRPCVLFGASSGACARRVPRAAHDGHISTPSSLSECMWARGWPLVDS